MGASFVKLVSCLSFAFVVYLCSCLVVVVKQEGRYLPVSSGLSCYNNKISLNFIPIQFTINTSTRVKRNCKIDYYASDFKHLCNFIFIPSVCFHSSILM